MRWLIVVLALVVGFAAGAAFFPGFRPGYAGFGGMMGNSANTTQPNLDSMMGSVSGRNSMVNTLSDPAQQGNAIWIITSPPMINAMSGFMQSPQFQQAMVQVLANQQSWPGMAQVMGSPQSQVPMLNILAQPATRSLIQAMAKNPALRAEMIKDLGGR
ncbi:MAG TPA: hypothetical protein VMW83_16535 [Spirochaetia bacterium]|nr:hypothetical protein [Spirochaetia bacterium]